MTSRVAPLSTAQEPLWYFSRLAPDDPVYNEAVSIRKNGPLDVDALRFAFNELVRRHEIWRSTFEVIDGEPMQVVQQPTTFELPVIDLSEKARTEAEAEAAAIAAADARLPYQLDRGPLLRPRLVRFADDYHRLYLAMHHLVFDGFSLNRIALRELIALYDAFLAGELSPLTDPALQYADYALSEREHADPARESGKLEFWRRRLRDAPLLQLPLDHPRPTHQRFRGAMLPICVPEELADRLRALCDQTGASLSDLTTAAFSVLLHRYSGQDDIVFATVANLRQGRELESMVGYCLTPAVLRISIDGDLTFEALLARVQRELVDARSNVVPFEHLLRGLRIHREPGANPVYQAMVVVEPQSLTPDPSWSVQQMDVAVGNGLGQAKLDLDIELGEQPQGHLRGRLIYNTDLFEPETARRMVDHWHTLLQGIAAHPDRLISSLPLLTDDELHRQLVEWNATSAEFPRETGVHQLVDAQVKAKPDAIAVDAAGNRLTYAELDRRANRIAHRLRAEGAGPGTLVGICMDRTADMVAGLLAVLKTGAAYLPLEPRYPTDRLAFILEDSGAALVLTQSNLLAKLPVHCNRICLETEEEALARQPDTAPMTTTSAEDVAYVLYTSGSTGRPKGVSVRHRSVVNLLTSMARELGISATDAVLAVTTTSFDMSVPEIWLPLVTGGRMVMAPADVAADGRRLGRLVVDSGVTFMQATPASWQLLIESGWSGSPGLVALSGGEALSTPLAGQLLDLCGTLWNAYGPTETTVWSTLGRVERGGPVTVGRPLANTMIYILDRWGRPVPVGVSGEVFIGGEGVTAGYLNREELTADRFVADPFAGHGRMYRTGDLGRYLPDGRIEILGRLDNQVKIRGFRIEPGEIEAVLLAHPGVAAAAVVARADASGGKALVAYVVPRDAMPAASELRDALRRHVPEYMVPSAFVHLEQLPLTSNGKLDRASLPAPDHRHGSDHTYAPPRSDLEATLVGVWSRTLGLERVGVHDDFFELGGHSLLAVRLLAEVERATGVAMPVASLFNGGATVAGLANSIEVHPNTGASELLVPVQPYGTKPVLFFMHADEASMLTLRHFTRPLGPDQPVLGLLPERVGYRFDPRKTVEDLAATMVAAVRSVQPHGPYYLAGYSMGGLFAYEVAGQLLAGGEEIGWLGLVDAGTPRVAARYISLRQRLARQRARTFGEASRKLWEIGSRSVRSTMRRLHLGRPGPGHDFDWRGAAKVARTYECRGHGGPLDVFATNDMIVTSHSRSLGWGDVHTGTLEVHEVLGNHFSMVQEPNVTSLSEMLASSVRMAQSARTEPIG
jgi:amino acid adenylation domain-containing protein